MKRRSHILLIYFSTALKSRFSFYDMIHCLSSAAIDKINAYMVASACFNAEKIQGLQRIQSKTSSFS